MSIYCSFGGFNSWTCPDYGQELPEVPADGACAITEDQHGRTRIYAMKSEPCAVGSGCTDCGGWEAPWAYEASHVMPTIDGVRDGDVHLAYIAAHIATPRERRAGMSYVDEREDGNRAHPWLRLGVDESIVLLHRSQVERLVESLASWLDHDFLPDEEYLGQRDA